MLSDALIECLPRQQVLAVMAHELGHVAHRHLAWMLPVILGAWWLGALIADPAAQVVFAALAARVAEADGAALAEAVALVRDLSVVVFGLLAFGFASRRFERQADTYAVRLLSSRAARSDATPEAVAAMTGALSMVSFVNHVPVERPSWRHGSIAWRQGYLRSLVGKPCARLGNDTLVRAICWIALAAVGAMVALAALASA
jgi:STE24 endopeptidase